MTQRGSFRASDADREQVAERLRHATAEGRLLAEELEQRLGAALSARTYGELDAVIADLPGKRVAHRERQRSGAMALGRPLLGLTILVALIMTAVLLVTGVFAVWTLWVVFGWWFFGHKHGFCGARCARSLHAGDHWHGSRTRSGWANPE